MAVTWLILVLVFVVIELLTVNLVTIWASIGALAALITTYFTDNINIQLCVFFLVTIITLLLTRKFIKQVVNPKKETTNLDSVIGKTGVVIKDITKSGGRVKVMGKDWAALSVDNSVIEVGKNVKIFKIEGVKLIVKEDIK